MDAEPVARSYLELKRIARGFLRREPRGHTLQPTALVHEAWLRLARQRRRLPAAELLGAAAGAMRLVLVDHARRRGRVKRGADAARVALEPALATRRDTGIDVLVVEEALGRLAQLDRELATLVELRCLAGLDEIEIAARLGLSPRTVRRRWRVAKMLLARDLERAP